MIYCTARLFCVKIRLSVVYGRIQNKTNMFKERWDDLGERRDAAKG